MACRRVWILALLSTACAHPLDLGTDVLWSADFEDGGLSGLSSPPGTGGLYVNDAGDSHVSITTEQAHSGLYAVKITSSADLPHPGSGSAGGGGLFKTGEFPEEAYYSAWYYLPEAAVTTTLWSILKFDAVTSPDAGSASGSIAVLDLSLESQGDGSMTLVLGDPNPAYRSSPLPTPVPVVPIQRWFQIEAFYRNATDASGHFTVWLDGAQIYDVARPTNLSTSDGGPNPYVYFTPCSSVYQLEEASADGGAPLAEIYIDDLAISGTRVTPRGVLQVPR